MDPVAAVVARELTGAGQVSIATGRLAGGGTTRACGLLAAAFGVQAGAALAQPGAPARPVSAPAVSPEKLVVAALGCQRGVQLESRGAPLSQVLSQLSQTLKFKLVRWAEDDPAITLATRQHPAELMQTLSTRANLMVRYAHDRRCPAHARIDTVWVLPVGAAAPVQAGRAPAPASPMTPAPGSDDPGMVLRAHGLSEAEASEVLAPAPAPRAPAPAAAGASNNPSQPGKR